MIFSHFKNAIAAQFKAMSSLTLLRVDINKDALWQTYLASFPEGSNRAGKQVPGRAEGDGQRAVSTVAEPKIKHKDRPAAVRALKLAKTRL